MERIGNKISKVTSCCNRWHFEISIGVVECRHETIAGWNDGMAL